MQHCEHCHVKINETRDHCPLCGNALEKEGLPLKTSFPVIPPYIKSQSKLKVLLFVSVVLVILSFTLYAFYPTELNWPLLVLLGLTSLWLDLVFLVRKRFHIPKKIVWQVFILSLLALFWDWNTGWRGWSITYVIPFLQILALVLMYAIALIMKLQSKDFITYAFMSALFGFTPLLFLLFDWVSVHYPAILSITTSSIILSAILILQWDSIRSEFMKRLHM